MVVDSAEASLAVLEAETSTTKISMPITVALKAEPPAWAGSVVEVADLAELMAVVEVVLTLDSSLSLVNRSWFAT